MSANVVPAPAQARGFRNLLGHENGIWWGSLRWLFQLAFGVIGLCGLLAFSLFILPPMTAAQGEPLDALEAGAQIFFGLGILAIAVDVIILTQDSVIGERQSGVAEWVLSKPVARSAYVLAKLLANGLGVLVTLIAVPSAIAYGLFWLATGSALPLSRFAAAVAILALHTAFYLALTIMMGVVANSRGVVLGVTLGSLLGGMLLANLIGPAALITPWPLANIVVGLVQGASLPTMALLPVAATALLTVAAALVAIWAFDRVEL